MVIGESLISRKRIRTQENYGCSFTMSAGLPSRVENSRDDPSILLAERPCRPDAIMHGCGARGAPTRRPDDKGVANAASMPDISAKLVGLLTRGISRHRAGTRVTVIAQASL